MRTAAQHDATSEHAGQPARTADTMRAIIQRRYGDAGVLQLSQLARPQIAGTEVLIRVRAAGLDRGTWHLVTGQPYLLRLAFGLRRPKASVPGRELAGTVVAVGAAVTGFAPGDEVFGIGRGALAEFAVADQAKLAHKPAAATFEQAAVLGVSGLTALQILRAAGPVGAGQSVLIIGASGGVGSLAVQLASSSGAEVTGVCSAGKSALVRSLGAAAVIDYARQDFAGDGRRYDVIIDLAGNPGLRRLRRALTATGIAVIAGGEQGGNLSGGMNRQLRALAWSPLLRQRLTGFICKERGSDLAELAARLEAGDLRPVIDRTFDLAEAVEAMRYLASGQVAGKLAITVG